MQFEQIIRINPAFIRIIPNPSIELYKLAFAASANELRYIKNQTDEMCLEAVKINLFALNCVKKQTDEICLEAVKHDGLALQYVKDQTDEICLEAVKRNYAAIDYVKKQTDEICLEAVKQHGLVLYLVKNQTNEICLEAVKQNGMALRYVKNQTTEICLEAVKQINDSICLIKNKTIDTYLKLVKIDTNVITLIDEENRLEIFNKIMEDETKFNLPDIVKEVIKNYCYEYNKTIDIIYINRVDKTNELVSNYNSIEQFIRDKIRIKINDVVYEGKVSSDKKEIYDDNLCMSGLFSVGKNNRYCIYRKNVRPDDADTIKIEKIGECYQINVVK